MKYRFIKYLLVFLFLININVNAKSTKKRREKLNKKQNKKNQSKNNNVKKPPKVPSKIKFAGMKLYLTETAQARVQDKVDRLTKWNHENMVQRANIFFQVFEPILKKENIPDDIKYLAIQESMLVPDIISRTKDYGIWAFQYVTAKEVGMRVDNIIDERFNVVSSTLGMAKYMKVNYKQFDNWIHALIAYNRGATGAKRVLNKQTKKERKKYRGNAMEIGGNTPEYIIHFLAHKIAFEKSVKRNKPEYKLHIHEANAGTSFNDIAKKYNVSIELIQEYNKWLKCKRVPKGECYKMLVPILQGSKVPFKGDTVLVSNPIELASIQNKIEIETLDNEFPIIKNIENVNGKKITIINGFRGIVAKKGASIHTLAKEGGIGVNLFLEYNDIYKTHKIIPGQVYYFEKKGTRVGARHHITSEGETWWSISQKYGLQRSIIIYRNNRTSNQPTTKNIKSRRLLWLKHLRPKKVPIEFVEE